MRKAQNSAKDKLLSSSEPVKSKCYVLPKHKGRSGVGETRELPKGRNRREKRGRAVALLLGDTFQGRSGCLTPTHSVFLYIHPYANA